MSDHLGLYLGAKVHPVAGPPSRSLKALGLRPATEAEVESWLEARVYELRNQGLIHDAGHRRRTRSGRQATVWQVPAGVTFEEPKKR